MSILQDSQIVGIRLTYLYFKAVKKASSILGSYVRRIVKNPTNYQSTII